ncbi:hypothetical protein Tco_1235106 [Tanacetum coccineum]
MYQVLGVVSMELNSYCVHLLVFHVIMEVDIDNMILNEYLMCDAKYRDLNYFCGVDINTLTMEEYLDLRLYVASKRRYMYKKIKDKKMSWVLFSVLMDKIDAKIPQPCPKFDFICHDSSREVDIDCMTLMICDLAPCLHPQPEKKELSLEEVFKTIDVNISREKEEVREEDVEMDEDDDINPLKNKEALQWCPTKDHFLVFMELKDHLTFMEHDIPSSIPNEVATARKRLDENTSTQVCSLKTLTRLHSSTRVIVAYAKCNRDSYERIMLLVQAFLAAIQVGAHGVVLGWYGYIKNHKKTVKNGQTRTRERKNVQEPKAKVKVDYSSDQEQDGKGKSVTQALKGHSDKREAHVRCEDHKRM